MGGSESKVSQKQEVEQNMVNNTDIKMIKKNVNKSMMNVITKKSASCSAQMVNKQKQELDLGDVGGDLVVGGGDQTIKATLQLKCVQLGKIQNDLARTIANNYSEQLNSKFDTSAMAKLGAEANAKAKSGFLPLGKSSSDVNIENKYKLNVTNNINKTMKNIIVNETNKTFNTDSMQKALSIAQNSQEQVIKATKVGGDAKVHFGNQEMAVKQFMDAVQRDEATNKTIDNITNQLNSISTTGVSTKAATTVTAKGTATSEAKGFDSIVDSITGMIGGIFKGWTSMIIIGLIVVAVIVGIFFMTGGQETLQQGIEAASGGSMNGGGIDSGKFYCALFKKLNNQQ
jgi:hypothetical protein